MVWSEVWQGIPETGTLRGELKARTSWNKVMGTWDDRGTGRNLRLGQL